jgi:uncharacterized lipoprotein YajG
VGLMFLEIEFCSMVLKKVVIWVGTALLAGSSRQFEIRDRFDPGPGSSCNTIIIQLQ